LPPSLLVHPRIPQVIIAQALADGPDPSALTPAFVKGYYGFDKIQFHAGAQSIPGDGRGQTIAIVGVADDQSFADDITLDLQQFNNAFGLPQMDGMNGRPTLERWVLGPTSIYAARVPPHQVTQNVAISRDPFLGKSPPPPIDGWHMELEADLQWAHAIAPMANILLVGAASTQDSDLYSAVNWAAAQPGVSVVSMSFGGLENYHKARYSIAPHKGVTFVASSGDIATVIPVGKTSPVPLVEYPASDPDVLAVGGTELDTSTSVPTERVWNNSNGTSAGGVSTLSSEPDYQKGVVPAGTTGRAVPDVAYIASDLPIVDNYDAWASRNGSGWFDYYGTSLGAPQWAALIAIANQGRALELPGRGPLNDEDATLPMIYGLPSSDFNDITQGGNGLYNAGPGFDFVTGRGTPHANLVVQDLIAPEHTQVVNHMLVVNGDAGGLPNDISLGVSGRIVTVMVNRQVERFDAGTIDGITINALGTNNVIDLLSAPGQVAVTINLSGGNDTVNVGDANNQLAGLGNLTVVGQGAGNTLNLNDQGDTRARVWTLTANAVSVAGLDNVNYQGLAGVTINGGSAGDTFAVQGTSAGTAYTLNTGAGNDAVTLGDSRQTLEEFVGKMTVNGQGGTNTLTINDQGELDPATQGSHSGYHSENDTWYAAAGGLPAEVVWHHVPAGVLAVPGSAGTVKTPLYWQNLQHIVFNDPAGGSTATHAFNANALAGTQLTLNGQTENDILVSGVSAGQQQTFDITGHNAGTVGNIRYSGVYYLIAGGSGLTTFKVHPGGYEDTLNGNSSPSVLDLSAYAQGTTVTVPTYYSDGSHTWGTVSGSVATWIAIAGVVGNTNDTLIGPDLANIWSLTGPNAGRIGGLTFSGFANLVGGGQADTFRFLQGGRLSGTLNGGGGVDTLDYSAYTGDVTVDLRLDTASLVGGSVSNIRNVVGSRGNDLLVGDGMGNSLTGGSGRNLLIAGSAAGTLQGNTGDDILIGGTTAYDGNLAALDEILSEWTRTDLGYSARVNHLLNGGGKNGSFKLNAATVKSNGGRNKLLGGAGTDLFYGNPSTDTTDFNSATEEFIAV
jgi:hypothetical protein